MREISTRVLPREQLSRGFASISHRIKTAVHQLSFKNQSIALISFMLCKFNGDMTGAMHWGHVGYSVVIEMRVLSSSELTDWTSIRVKCVINITGISKGQLLFEMYV